MKNKIKKVENYCEMNKAIYRFKKYKYRGFLNIGEIVLI